MIKTLNNIILSQVNIWMIIIKITSGGKVQKKKLYVLMWSIQIFMINVLI